MHEDHNSSLILISPIDAFHHEQIFCECYEMFVITKRKPLTMHLL